MLKRFHEECPRDALIEFLSTMRRKQNYLNLGQLSSLPGISEPTLGQIRQFEAEFRRRLSMRTRLRIVHRMDMVVIGFLSEHLGRPDDASETKPGRRGS